jgi:hypothetical protein
MVMSYWEDYAGPCEPAVRAAVTGIYDWVYDGTGNWPFNTAYAATRGLHGSVRRFSTMEEVEAWVAQGVPVVIGFSWGKGELTGAALASSAGHLAVVVGFDSQGNPSSTTRRLTAMKPYGASTGAPSWNPCGWKTRVARYI